MSKRASAGGDAKDSMKNSVAAAPADPATKKTEVKAAPPPGPAPANGAKGANAKPVDTGPDKMKEMIKMNFDDDKLYEPASFGDQELKIQQAEIFRKYLETTGITMAFQIICAEIIAKKIDEEKVFEYTATRLREIGKEVAALQAQHEKEGKGRPPAGGAKGKVPGDKDGDGKPDVPATANNQTSSNFKKKQLCTVCLIIDFLQDLRRILGYPQFFLLQIAHLLLLVFE
eukprot:TRINITY_DN4631_c0_g1_i1.p1 TRINITY_DN4631_c0_g1~~TRINITY_DN4631_c0_g1_i1.p1  ORF type:complete len:229 (-),score=47.67 TRINITY_DN4631_c0_g1_i1:157-843(-)